MTLSHERPMHCMGFDASTYRVVHKRKPPNFITSSNIPRFSQFFYWYTQQQYIFNAEIRPTKERSSHHTTYKLLCKYWYPKAENGPSISQGSETPGLRCGGIFINHFISIIEIIFKSGYLIKLMTKTRWLTFWNTVDNTAKLFKM